MNPLKLKVTLKPSNYLYNKINIDQYNERGGVLSK